MNKYLEKFIQKGYLQVRHINLLAEYLGNKLETSLLKTTLAGNLDTDIPSVKAVNSGLSLKAGLTSNNAMSGDNIYTGMNTFTDGDLLLPVSTPINAVAAGVVLTVNNVPESYVKNVNSYITIEVLANPNTVVDNVNSFGIIEVSTILTAAQEFTIGAVTFVAVATLTEPAVEGEVLIGTDAADQAAEIVNAITRDSVAALVTATANGTTITVTAIEAGIGGDVVVFSESIDSIVMTPATGTLSGGVDAVVADTITLDTDTYTFVTGTPEVDEIQVGVDVTETALNIINALPATLTGEQTGGIILITAVADGVAGDGIVVNTTAATIIGGGVTANGQDEVISFLSIGGLDYIFYEAIGDNPAIEYPDCVPVLNDTVAINLEAALILDTENFSETSVTRDDNVITAYCKTRGVIGNSILYKNNLLTAGDITDNLTGSGHLVGGVDGTFGYKGQIYFDDALFVCTATNNTTTNTAWKTVALTDIV